LRRRQRHIEIAIRPVFFSEERWQILVQFGFAGSLLSASEHGEGNDRQALNFAYSESPLPAGWECPVACSFGNLPPSEVREQAFVKFRSSQAGIKALKAVVCSVEDGYQQQEQRLLGKLAMGKCDLCG
jgi:hypothetical protein